MTLATDIRRLFWRDPQPADYDAYPIEYAPDCGDIVINIWRDAMCVVTAIGYPFNDNVERYFVEGGTVGNTWTAWLSIEEIF